VSKGYEERNMAKGLCRCGRKPAETGKKTCRICLKNRTANRRMLRKKVIEEYGGRCQCPGGCDVIEPDFLAIDHIKGDGWKFRQQTRIDIISWLSQNGFPKDNFRLLCHNCNMARYFTGICPHEMGNIRELDKEYDK
jgi:hypothetical protein